MNKASAVFGFILSFLAGMFALWALERRGQIDTGIHRDTAAAGAKVNPGAVKAELFVMSQCPYGVQAEAGMFEAVQKLGADVDFTLDYIGQASPELTSLHGPKEVTGDKAQLCAKKLDPTKAIAFVQCQNKSYREVDTNWEACAAQNGIPVEKLRACVQGEEGKKLLADSFGRATQRGVSASPGVYIGGKPYQGGRRANDLLKAMCAEYKGAKPAPCASIPESPKVNATLLTDKRCAECDVGRYQGMLKTRVANPVITTLDYAQPEGRKLYEDTKAGSLPALVFDRSIEADKEALEAFRSAKTAGDYRVVALGGSWNPVCHNDGGCALDECKGDLSCRTEEPNHLDLFVMSQCPYGTKALDAMRDVLGSFKDQVAFKVHYIGDGDAKAGLKSMHGQGEVDEDLRQVCAQKHYAKGQKYMDYVWCRNKDIRNPKWEACATGDIKADVLRTCAEGDEGRKLLEAEFATSRSSGISSSPTWLANNRYKFNGLDPESVRKNLCDHNKGLKGCDKALSTTSAPVQGGCGG